MNRMYKAKRFTFLLAACLSFFALGCAANGGEISQSSQNQTQTELEWVSNDYLGFDYSRGQLNISGDGTAVTCLSPCAERVDVLLKSTFAEKGSFDLLFGFTAAPIYYAQTTLEAPAGLSGIRIRVFPEEICVTEIVEYAERELCRIAYAFPDECETGFGRDGENVFLDVNGTRIFSQKANMAGSYYGFGASGGTILRVYPKEKTP